MMKRDTSAYQLGRRLWIASSSASYLDLHHSTNPDHSLPKSVHTTFLYTRLITNMPEDPATPRAPWQQWYQAHGAEWSGSATLKDKGHAAVTLKWLTFSWWGHMGPSKNYCFVQQSLKCIMRSLRWSKLEISQFLKVGKHPGPYLTVINIQENGQALGKAKVCHQLAQREWVTASQ